jgi:5-methylcytosine-specific restriction endonuclease McrA
MARRKTYTDQELSAIYDRGRGNATCATSSSTTATTAAEAAGGRGIANGGTDHGNNLKPACIRCNEDKSTTTSRTARRRNGRKKAPFSPERYEREKASNTVGGGAIGAAIGGAFGGPPGALAGCLLGLAIGNSINPDE